MPSSESRKTVLIALGANAGIFVTKAVGGVLSGSTALLAEAAHSLADTTNQLFLLVSLSLGSRPADEQHPFGHGQDRFLWAFMAAIFMFVGGAVFAVGYGIKELLAAGEEGNFAIAWVVLGICSVLEVGSWLRAIRQAQGEARAAGLPFLRFIRESREPTSKAVVFEDSAAVVGIAFAAAGVGLHQATGNPAWDAVGAIAVGLLLIATAFALGGDIRGLLVGEAARPDERERIEAVLRRHDEFEVLELLTLTLGPSALLVAARIDLRDDLRALDIERLSSRVGDELHEEVPDVLQVFLDPTLPGRDHERQRRVRETAAG